MYLLACQTLFISVNISEWSYSRRPPTVVFFLLGVLFLQGSVYLLYWVLSFQAQFVVNVFTLVCCWPPLNLSFMSVVLSDTPLLVSEVLWFCNSAARTEWIVALRNPPRLNKDASLGKYAVHFGSGSTFTKTSACPWRNAKVFSTVVYEKTSKQQWRMLT